MSWGMRNIKIALFGSSIMEGRLGVEKVSERYYSILHKTLSERFPEVCFSIFNGSVGGWSTRELMKNFDEFILQYEPDYCMVMFGANNNDLANPARILAEGELESLMEEFETKLPKKVQRTGVVLNPVINECHMTHKHPAWQEAIKKWHGLDEILEAEREKVRAFYRKYNYPVVDLSILMRKEMKKYVCGDGIHLTAEGHKLFAGEACKVLERLLVKNGHDSNIDLNDKR